jgi:hypothetical protein
VRPGKVNELFVYDNFSRVTVDEVQAGDICAVTGIQDIGVSCLRLQLLLCSTVQLLYLCVCGAERSFVCLGACYDAGQGFGSAAASKAAERG